MGCFNHHEIPKIKISVVFLSVCIVSSVFGRSELSFLLNNSCGCFYNHDGDCYESCKPSLPSKNIHFKGFVPNVLGYCQNWFIEGYNISHMNTTDGRISVTLLLSPWTEAVKFEVFLNVWDEITSKMIFHSRKFYSTNGYNISKSDQIEFSYLYSGTYQLEIKKDAEICKTEQFTVTSLLEEVKLYELAPFFYHKYFPETYLLVYYSGDRLFMAEKVEINLALDGVAQISVVMNLHGASAFCCDYFQFSNFSQISSCPCKINEENDNQNSTKNIKCIFNDVPDGNYSVTIVYVDPRCIPDSRDESCAWFNDFYASGNLLPSNMSMNLSIKKETYLGMSVNLTLVFVVVFIAVSLIIAIITIDKTVFKKSNTSWISPNLDSLNQNSSFRYCSLTALQKILLLYPRDCEAFMKTMIEFRKCLKNNNFKVNDPWDEEIYDDVVASCEAWILSLIKDDKTKIIIVLTECSKLFEQSFLENSVLTYQEPQMLDMIFCHSLSIIHLYFAQRHDSYQRIFVVRLPEYKSRNFEFITPATVYTIPENIEVLYRDLGIGKEINHHNHIKLMTSIEEYHSFKEANQDHLYKLLNFK